MVAGGWPKTVAAVQAWWRQQGQDWDRDWDWTGTPRGTYPRTLSFAGGGAPSLSHSARCGAVCAFPRARARGEPVFSALKFCVAANKILVSHMPSPRIRRSVICCATLFLATRRRTRASQDLCRAANLNASCQLAASARLSNLECQRDRDGSTSTCLDLDKFLYTLSPILSGR